MCDQDEIWIGRVEKFLKQDDVIVESFVTGLVPSLIHFIVDRNESISNFKSMAAGIIPEIINIWDAKGNEMRSDQIITEIDLIGGYYKLIISRDDGQPQTFDYHCKIHDQYFVGCISVIFDYYYPGLVTKQQKSETLIKLVDKCRQILALSTIDNCRMLEENFSQIPVSYVNSRFLFSVDMAKRIWDDVCDEFWKLVIGRNSNLSRNWKNNNFLALLRLIIVNHCVKSRAAFADDNIDKSIRDILIDTMEHFVNFLIDDRKDEFLLLKLFAKYFLFGSYDNEAMCKMVENWTLQRKMFRVKIQNLRYMVDIFASSAEKIVDMKKAIRQQTNFPIDKLYCIKYGSSEQPQDDEKMIFYPDYFFEILMDAGVFKISEKLGQGGFGEIYLCNDICSKTKVVLKKPYGKNKGGMESVYRDVSMNSLFKCLNYPDRYVNLVIDNGTICMVMNYLSGGSLSSKIEKVKVLDENEIRKICFQLLLQIKEIHALNIIHRDINCDNIVFDQYGNASLIDYGISKCINEASAAQLQEDLSRNFVGNQIYCSPEYLNAEPYTNKVDIWSLGAVTITMATGKRPYSKTSETMASIKIKTTKKIIYESRKVSKKLKNFIDLCLTPDPDERPNVDELLQSEFIQNHQ